MALFDSKTALNHAIRYLADAAQKRAAGGWIPPKEQERQQRAAMRQKQQQARQAEKQQKEAARADEKQQKLLSKQYPTHYMPEVGRQVMNTGGTPDQPQRQLSPMGFYSAAAERAQTLQPSGDAVQMVNALKNTQGIKTEELQNAGLIDQSGNVHPDWAGRGKVTRDELVSHLQGQMPQVEETVLGARKDEYGYRFSDEWENAIYEAEQNKDWDEVERLNRAWEHAEGKPAKYEQYTLPGGENYREVLLKLPKKGGKDLETLYKTREDLLRQRQVAMDELTSLQSGTPEFAAAKEKYDSINKPLVTINQGIEQLKEQVGGFRSSHWDDPNVLAHIRMADRTGPNGEKILHVEELQSDWGQKGKKEGFKNQAEFDAWKKNHDDAAKEVSDARAQMNDYFNDPSRKPQFVGGEMSPREYEFTLDHYRESLEQDPKFLALRDAYRSANQQYVNLQNTKPKLSGVASAPYVTSTEGWTDLALKRVLKEAAEGGYDKIVWTPGAEQAKRYDLSKQISELELVHNKNGEGKLTFVDKNLVPHQQDVKNPEHLAELVGKDLAEKLYEKSKENNGMARLTGLDLKVGGEGMKGYYDTIVPKRLQNLAKKHDKNAKLGYTETHHRGQVSNAPMSYTLPSLDITPAMRESILRGQSAYKRGGTVSKKHPALSISGTHIREEEHGEPMFTGRL